MACKTRAHGHPEVISVSKLCCGAAAEGDRLRFRHRGQGGVPRPVVVWNATRRCNLRCRHCYSASDDDPAEGELSGDEARAMIDDVARFGAPVLLLSGGEPTLRPDLPELAAFARDAGLRTALSTNGTRITPKRARRLVEAGVAYAGVSFDGPAEANDRFRGVAGAFDAALAGLRACRDAGIKVGLRFTITRENARHVPAMFDLALAEGIGRLCFYHLVSVGRGARMNGEAPSHGQTREVLDAIIDRTYEAHRSGAPLEVLTVDNHADAAYVQLRLAREDAARAAACAEQLGRQGGNATGERIGCIAWNGDVHPDPFWRSRVLGNVRDRPFSKIWSDVDGLLGELRRRPAGLTGRCTRCRWLHVCNGNMRARAEAAGDAWGDDPACYLTEAEIEPEPEPEAAHG